MREKSKKQRAKKSLPPRGDESRAVQRAAVDTGRGSAPSNHVGNRPAPNRQMKHHVPNDINLNAAKKKKNKNQ